MSRGLVERMSRELPEYLLNELKDNNDNITKSTNSLQSVP